MWIGTGLIAGLCGMSLLAVETAESAAPLPTIPTSAILAGERLTGPDFRVGATARNDGFPNRFSLTVDGEVHDVAGNALEARKWIVRDNVGSVLGRNRLDANR